MFQIMKANLWLIGLILIGGAAHAETAYEALRSLGQTRGEEILNQVVEVNGQGGTPQPTSWTVVTSDPAARGGVRVFGVRDGQIVSEKTPTGRQGDAVPMNFNLLNLDSAGAFGVAEQEAKGNRIGFERVNYLLQPSRRSAAPVWVIDLIDRSGSPTASVEVSAQDGQVVEVRSRSGAQQPGNAAEEPSYPVDNGGVAVQQRPVYDVGSGDNGGYDEGSTGSGEGGFLSRMQRFGKRVERHFQRDGAVVEKFFTGESTIDPEEDRR